MASLCRQPFVELHIRKNGDVYACAGGQFIGNLKFNSALELWNCERMLELRRQLTENNFDNLCLNCSLFNNKKILLENSENLNSDINFQSLKKIGEDFFIGETKLFNFNNAYGFVDIFKRSRDKTFFEGWAIDRSVNTPATYIVVLVNEVYFWHSQVNLDRFDVAESLKKENLQKCGFKFESPFISIERKVSFVIFNEDYKLLGEISTSGLS